MKNTTTIIKNDSTTISVVAAWVAVIASVATLLFLLVLHLLSPEFSPAWRMVSEYAYGHYGWVLSLMFFSWGISSWALTYAIRSQVSTKAGKVGLWFLVIAGIGEAMAGVLDINHDIGHGIAGFLGVGGFPIAAMLLSISLSRLQMWKGVKKLLFWLAHLSWISVVLLIASLILMTVQVFHVMGKLPTHAPTALPPGVIGLDGWADRLLVLIPCLWILFAAWQIIKIYSKKS